MLNVRGFVLIIYIKYSIFRVLINLVFSSVLFSVSEFFTLCFHLDNTRALKLKAMETLLFFSDALVAMERAMSRVQIEVNE